MSRRKFHKFTIFIKIRIRKTGSSGSRGFKINTGSTATGTPLVESHEVANIKAHANGRNKSQHCCVSSANIVASVCMGLKV